jgi:hypothetical protein
MKSLEKLQTQNVTIGTVLSGIVTICSVPPSGSGPMTVRYLKRSLLDS